MNTTKKLLVIIISTLAIATAPAIASNHHLSKPSTNKALNGPWCWIITKDEIEHYDRLKPEAKFYPEILDIHPSVVAQQQKGRGGAGRLLGPGAFSPGQMAGGLVPGLGADVMGGPGVGLPMPQAGEPTRAPVNIVDDTKNGLAGKGAFEHPPIGIIVHYTDAVKGHAPNLNEMLDIGRQRGLYAQKFIDEQGVMHQLVPEGQISYHAKGGFKGESRANFLYEGVEIASIHGAKNPKLTAPAANEAQMATLASYYYQQKEAAEAAGRSYTVRGHSEIPGNADRINEGVIEACMLRSGVGKPVVADQGGGLPP